MSPRVLPRDEGIGGDFCSVGCKAESELIDGYPDQRRTEFAAGVTGSILVMPAQLTGIRSKVPRYSRGARQLRASPQEHAPEPDWAEPLRAGQSPDLG
jgi:hypothetical protein